VPAKGFDILQIRFEAKSLRAIFLWDRPVSASLLKQYTSKPAFEVIADGPHHPNAAAWPASQHNHVGAMITHHLVTKDYIRPLDEE
jgi:hypothetical protein